MGGIRFVGASIEPVPGAGDADALARGEPGPPAAFFWEGRRYEITRVASRWKTTRTDRGEKYVARHWFEVETASGETMRISCERRPRTRGARWSLYTVAEAESPAREAAGEPEGN
jgi:hypothetical protein